MPPKHTAIPTDNVVFTWNDPEDFQRQIEMLRQAYNAGVRKCIERSPYLVGEELKKQFITKP